MYKSKRNEWVQKNEWVWKKKHGLITGDCPVCCVHKGLCSFWGSFLGKRKVAVLAALNRLLNRWGPQCLGRLNRSLNHTWMFLRTQQLMERLKRIVKLPHRLKPVQSSKVSRNSIHSDIKKVTPRKRSTGAFSCYSFLVRTTFSFI